MAHIGESRILATHLIHTKTQQVLHLLLESAFIVRRAVERQAHQF